jgi:hypothetical protein
MIGADLITGDGGGACWSGALLFPLRYFPALFQSYQFTD